MKEELKIRKEVKFLDSINKWCVAIYCARPKHTIWTGGFFHKNKEKAEQLAMQSFEKSLAFYRELEKPTNSEELTIFA